MPRLTLRARYVFPVAGEPIPDGSITIDGPRIVALGRKCGDGEVLDLGNAAILPGLVNAHAHLDCSDVTSPLGNPGIDFVDWIRLVIDYRRTLAAENSENDVPGNSRGPTARGSDPILHGLQETLRHGVTTLGEIAQPGWHLSKKPSVNLTVFQELIAPTPDRIPAALESAKAHLHTFTPSHLHTFTPSHLPTFPPSHLHTFPSAGLSPHAPFSVHPELLTALISLSATEKVPLAMHLAESREEIELLRHGSGPMRKFLEELGAWDATAMRPGTRPLDYLRRLASAHRALVIHGNYLDDEEIAFLGGKSDRMSVVYCPRTHDWFDRGEYPLQKMLSAGVAVALGTDGRGSSPDLSLLAEMRFAARRHPTVGLDRILRMGTLGGAKALGQQQHVGSLEPDKQADLTIVALPDRDAADPHELLFDSEQPVIACYFRGNQIPIKTTDEHR